MLGSLVLKSNQNNFETNEDGGEQEVMG